VTGPRSRDRVRAQDRHQLDPAATSLLGCSGVTCWRRLRDWTEAGVWPALHEQLLAQLRALGELDLDRCAVDGSHVRALKGETTSARHRSTAAVSAPRIT
jgi:transposase